MKSTASAKAKGGRPTSYDVAKLAGLKPPYGKTIQRTIGAGLK